MEGMLHCQLARWVAETQDETEEANDNSKPSMPVALWPSEGHFVSTPMHAMVNKLALTSGGCLLSHTSPHSLTKPPQYAPCVALPIKPHWQYTDVKFEPSTEHKAFLWQQKSVKEGKDRYAGNHNLAREVSHTGPGESMAGAQGESWKEKSVVQWY